MVIFGVVLFQDVSLQSLIWRYRHLNIFQKYLFYLLAEKSVAHIFICCPYMKFFCKCFKSNIRKSRFVLQENNNDAFFSE